MFPTLIAKPVVVEFTAPETSSDSGSLLRRRRVVGKAETTPEGENRRFVVHNLREGSPAERYRFYAQRGEMENGIKELKLVIKVDRTSCHRSLAHAFCVILYPAAYVLWVALRACLAGTELAQAQVSTLREWLIEVAGFVTASVRREPPRSGGRLPGRRCAREVEADTAGRLCRGSRAFGVAET